MKTVGAMVHIVEDQDGDLRALRQALTMSGIADSDISDSRSYEEAWTKVKVAIAESKARMTRSSLPVVMVADIGLKHEVENGVALLGNVFRTMVEERQIGLWTVAVTAHPLDRIPQERPYIPHLLLQKDIGGRRWPRTCARAVAALVGGSLPGDGPTNDLAPLVEVPPYDRIYIYERGDSVYSNIALDGPQFGEYFDLGLVQPRLRELRATPYPVLMCRGRYVPISQHSPGKLPRALLRARTVLRARRRDVSVAELMTFDESGELDSLPSGHGIPPKGLGNYFSWFRGFAEARALLEDFVGASLDVCFPGVTKPDGWLIPTNVLDFKTGSAVLSDGWATGPFLRCPPDLRTDPPGLGFFTLLQFVLSEQEIANYREWIASWRQHTRAWERVRP